MASTGDWRKRVARNMSEGELQGNIVQLAEQLGWRVYFVPDWVWKLIWNRMKNGISFRNKTWSRPGFPDLVMVRRGRLIFAELKTHYKEPREDQEEWLRALEQVPGIEVYRWKPMDWLDGTVHETLERTDRPAKG